jgi:hypothetical protein
MTTTLTVTARSDLRDGSGANTHFCFNPSVYSVGSSPNAHIVQALVDLKVGYIRERWWPKNPAQQAAFVTLTNAGIGLYVFIGDKTYTTAQVQSDVAALAASPFASALIAVCGPNEPNAGGGSTWPAAVVAVQQAIYTEVSKYAVFDHTAIVGPALMHNVRDIDADYRALAAAGVGRWCDAGDFHFYPGNAGPSGNAAEAQRAGQAYGGLSLWHSETGWTGADTDPGTAGRFSVEALLRNHLSGIVGTMLYGFADESQYVPGREGLFGLMTATAPKPAYSEIQALMKSPDGTQAFHGRLASLAKNVESDTGAVVTSDGGNTWTVYLLRETQTATTLVIPQQFSADCGSFTLGSGGNRRYSVTLTESMTVVHVQQP